MNNASMGVYAKANNGTQLNVLSSALYAISIQDETNSLPNVISGLRKMDSCLVPWISTAYCYADVGRKWEMAFSNARQLRCVDEVNNGAVYLETILRNVDWDTLQFCWGLALETAVFSPLRGTNEGSSWLASITTNRLTEENEVAWWVTNGVTRFTTQWQNYKSLGVMESFLITNALGVEYPLTIKKSNSSFQFSAATSYKMHWGFANILTRIHSNTSLLSGHSMVRQSSTFAFLNQTMEDIYYQEAILIAPLDPALSIFHNQISPFGVVDLKRVSPPHSLQELYKDMDHFVRELLDSSVAIQNAYWKIYIQIFLTPQPKVWDGVALWGGDINCGVNYGGSYSAPFQYFSSNGLCGNYLTDYIATFTQNVIYSLLSMEYTIQMSDRSIENIAKRDLTHEETIVSTINSTLLFLKQYCSPSQIIQFHNESNNVRKLIRDTMKLELIHYYSSDGIQYDLSRVNVFASSENELEFYSWLYLFEWIEGKREVVSYIGDIGSLTTISTVQNYVERPVNPLEIPLNVSFYFLALIQYITIVLFGVGCLVCIYIVSSRGFIEGTHMFAFNFVAGHVWIGRPLVLLRGLTAISLLSTSNLDLIRPNTGLLSYFSAPPRFWLTTLLSSSEMSWLVYVIIDTFSILTSEFTAGYSTVSSIAVCIAAAIWSFVSPTNHQVTLMRSCIADSVDFNIVCSSGNVHIGDFTRFCRLIGLAFGGSFVCYVFERVRHPIAPPKLKPLSYFLYSAAKHTFEESIHITWEHDGIYYVDTASAALTGILTLTLDKNIYILDIKMWRVYVMTPQQLSARGEKLPPHLHTALPLIE